MSYDYQRLVSDINMLTENYGFIESFSVGKSVMEKDIPCLKAGGGSKKLLLAGAYHDLEYLTSAFLMKFAVGYTTAYVTDTDFFGSKAADLFNRVTLYIIPMVNPNGVDIAVNGLDITNPYHRQLISLVGIHSFNHVWQANARGVDLNHNYDAGWDIVAENPAPTKYAGNIPDFDIFGGNNFLRISDNYPCRLGR